MNPRVDEYMQRSDLWPDEIAALRPIMLAAGLTEELKWAKPCYSHKGKNIVIFQEMKDHLSVMFFKGALLSDPVGILRQQGPNSRAAKRIEFTSVEEVHHLADAIAEYIAEAIDVEDAGLEVGPAPEPDLAEELQERLDADPSFKAAFEALTPGRRREYNLYISDAKQSKTRAGRVAKYIPKILEGKGLRDR